MRRERNENGKKCDGDDQQDVVSKFQTSASQTQRESQYEAKKPSPSPGRTDRYHQLIQPLPMTASDPDFLLQLEANRFQPKANNVISTRVQAKCNEKNKDYWNELISLRLMPPALASSNSQTKINTKITWTVPHFRLTERFLQEAVKRESSPIHFLSHLFDPMTQTVFYHPRTCNLNVVHPSSTM